MRVNRRDALIAGASLALLSPAQASERLLTGVNLAGLELNSGRLPGVLDRDFVAPSAAELDQWRDRGAGVVRVPFLWERLQPELGGAFEGAYWRLLERLIDATGERSMHIVLDAHQYGRRRINGDAHIIGESSAVSAAHFSAFWREIATRCRQRTHVIFNLQNEPHGQDQDVLVQVSNEAIASIRSAGANQLILASGAAWSGAHSWVSSGNARSMLEIEDPANAFAFDVHQYLDRDSSGTDRACIAGSGARLAPFTAWARQHNRRGFLGEFGAASNDACLTELGAILEHVAGARDVWLGWTCWGAGPWWDEDYPLRLSRASREGRDPPQTVLLQRYFE